MRSVISRVTPTDATWIDLDDRYVGVGPVMSDSPTPWVSVAAAASFLGLSPDRLRRTIERHARKEDDGSVESSIDGVLARKFGRLWRVRFSPSWTR